MSFCDQCGSEVRNTANFCDQCVRQVRPKRPAPVQQGVPLPSYRVQTPPTQPPTGPSILPETHQLTAFDGKRKFLKWSVIGCGGLLGIFLLLVMIGALVPPSADNAYEDNGSSSPEITLAPIPKATLTPISIPTTIAAEETEISGGIWDRSFWEEVTVEELTAALDNGLDVQSKDEHGDTPLHYAAEFNGDPRVISLLLDRGVEIDDPGRGLTPLLLSAGNNSRPVVAFLLERGADVSARAKDSGYTPLHYAAQNEDVDVVRLFLQHGADARATNGSGTTPLHVATQQAGREAGVKLLLEAGADPSARNRLREACLLITVDGVREYLPGLCAATPAPSHIEPTSAATAATPSSSAEPTVQPTETPIPVDWRGSELEGADLQDANLRYAKLEGVNLSKANLESADLFEANLQGAILEEANLSNASFSGANLSGANLQFARIHWSDDYGLKVNFNGADLTEANLRWTFLPYVHMSGATLKGADLEEADMSMSRMWQTNFEDANLHKANLEGAYLEDANFNGADLSWSDLRNANLNNADLRKSNLHAAKLRGATLAGTDLRETNLAGDFLEGINLQGANLQGVNLEDSSLAGSNLVGADLTGANLQGVDLRGANLAGAKLPDNWQDVVFAR